MSVATIPVQQATIRQYAKDLKLATVGGQFLSMAEEAVKQKHGHLSYLEALLAAEVEDRYQHGVARRIAEAHFPKVKTLEDFAFSDAPHLPAAQIRNLAGRIRFGDVGIGFHIEFFRERRGGDQRL